MDNDNATPTSSESNEVVRSETPGTSAANEPEFWAVTYRGTAEMVVWVNASSQAEAKQKAEDGDYEDATQVEFVRGKSYTMKAKRAPEHQPGDDHAL